MIITGKKFSKPKLSRVINGDDELIVDAEKEDKARLDLCLTKIYPEYKRATLQTFIKSGYVLVDDEVADKPNFKVKITRTSKEEYNIDQKISLNLPDDMTSREIKKQAIEKMRPDTIYENDDLIVVDKPTGLLSMSKGEINFELTLEDYGLLVHRLDRDTSGVVILAKTPETQTFLRKQFQDRKAHKTYYAIVEGRPKMDEAMIDLPISRNRNHPTTFLVDANGKPSQTIYKVIKSAEVLNQESGKPEILSLLELKPTTGRTHQLRVHLKYVGNPILGDRVYGNAKPDTNNRLYLHAKELEITIPGNGKNVRKAFTANLTKSFADIFKKRN